MEEGYDYNKIKEVGKISYEALQHSRKIVKEGKSVLGIAEELENLIAEKGFEMAFPVNVSINENAAHYTPTSNDPYILKGNEIVKIDIGARKGTYLGDCALTIDLSQKYSKLVEATEKALEAAISMVKAGRKVREIGKEIERIAEGAGFKPIRNLGGHGISQEDLHADVFVPNFDNGDETELEEGQVIAIEPFLTDGEGLVSEGEFVEIFQKNSDPQLRSNESREISEIISRKYLTFPFALRWLNKELKNFGEFKIKRTLNDLVAADSLELFPVLVEKKKGMVAQAEKEVIVQKDSCEVITK